MKTILASRNQGKFREFKALLENSGLDLAPLSDWPQVGELSEKGETFLENARQKARAVAARTGLPALADDSGLVVDALGGRPGVFSARYAGEGTSDEAKWQKVLRELKNTPWEERRAAFVCVLVLAWPDGREIAAEGRCEGCIAFEAQGEGGFGYDPIFYLPRFQATMAQLDLAAKNRISHRAEAARRLKGILEHQNVGE